MVAMKTQEKSLHGETFVLTSLNLETFVCKAGGLALSGCGACVVCFHESNTIVKNQEHRPSCHYACCDLRGTLFSSLAFPVAHVQRLSVFFRWPQASAMLDAVSYPDLSFKVVSERASFRDPIDKEPSRIGDWVNHRFATSWLMFVYRPMKTIRNISVMVARRSLGQHVQSICAQAL